VVLRLSEDANWELDAIAPLVAFFAMPENEQIAVLPVLEERKYGFPAGDWITSNALEVLMFAYEAHLNSISIWPETIQEMRNASDNNWIKDLAHEDLVDLENLVDLLDKLLSITRKIEQKYFEVIDNAGLFRTVEWKNLRQLSSSVQQKLQIQLVVNTEIVKNCVECWLHP
jgi:hypothetical protein